ncbi:riboflavin biosynthesis protein PYRD, chloroplastic [Cynara cardunculus var. scolymus]|uniref:riboflavin biosynthesis protein PYRD, chloroplastic n=1 Tax=Cynara cardunculus var. scolymus TaxID=59895 RepID=UPI000D62BAD0|nr:riboflavin biosynthesis protein PYRD, chloroplastic [Cynara cardunculus var. scolymus]
MYCQTLPISNYNLNPTNTSSSFHCLNPNAQPIQFAKFQSVSKFRFGFCNSIRRVSVSPNNLRKHVGLVGIRCEGLQGKEDTKDDDDKVYIKRCLELARKAVGCTSPNPMVGCVIVKDDKIVGEGFHPKAGQPHAEVFALRDAGDLAENATAYVSLEPCNHHGRTPPCSEALIKAKVKKVVVGMVDPNPIVASRGVAKLRDAGIDVTVGVEEEMCKKLNEAWIHQMQTGKPFVTLRYSLTINGSLSDDLGEESTEAGGYYSRLLQEHDAVVLSSKSLQKHPLPESKEPNSNQPLHIVLVKRPDLPHLTLQEETASKVIIFTDQETDMGSEQGIETVVLDKMNLTTILEHCQHQGLCSVLLDLRGSFGDFEDILKGVEENLVQKFVVEVLPVWGESKEEASFEAIKISQRAGLKNLEPKTEGKSVLLEGYF